MTLLSNFSINKSGCTTSNGFSKSVIIACIRPPVTTSHYIIVLFFSRDSRKYGWLVVCLVLFVHFGQLFWEARSALAGRNPIPRPSTVFRNKSRQLFGGAASGTARRVT